jgi:hypothetical protein
VGFTSDGVFAESSNCDLVSYVCGVRVEAIDNPVAGWLYHRYTAVPNISARARARMIIRLFMISFLSSAFSED